MNTQLVSITPEMAAQWLAGRERNRPQNKEEVERYARAMRCGRWHLTHQGIAFNEDGRLVDGQHRLAAIVLYGFPVTMMVTRGVSSEAMLSAVDGGSARRAGQRVAMEGIANANAKASAARWIWFFENAHLNYTEKADHEELMEIIRRRAAEIEYCVGASKNGFRPVASLAAVGAMTVTLPGGRDWFDGVVTGVGLAIDDPRGLARNLFIARKAESGSSSAIDLFAKIVSSADMWLHKESGKKLYASRQRYQNWSLSLGYQPNRSLVGALDRNR